MEQCEDHNKFCEMMGTIGANIVNLTTGINNLNNRIDDSFESIAQHIRESHIYHSKIDQLEVVMKLHIEAEEKKAKEAMWRIGLMVGIVTVIVQMIINIGVKCLL